MFDGPKSLFGFSAKRDRSTRAFWTNIFVSDEYAETTGAREVPTGKGVVAWMGGRIDDVGFEKRVDTNTALYDNATKREKTA